MQIEFIGIKTTCLAQYEHGCMFFSVATEAHDHDGLPHTLEHLVFMGSEDYPYKVRCHHLLLVLASERRLRGVQI